MPRARLRTSACFALALLLPLTPPALAQQQDGLAGAYLAARSAVIDGNHRVAARYFDEALLADPTNPTVIGSAMLAHAALGEWQRAADISQALPDMAEGQELAHLVRLVAALSEGDLGAARTMIAAGQGAGRFVDGLALAWIYLGEGDMTQAVSAFQDVAENDRALTDIAYIQLGFARAAVGDFEGADAILSGERYGRLSTTEQVVEARATILVQLGRRDEALELLDFFTDTVPDPSLITLRAQIAESDSAAPYDFLTTAEEGVAEVFFAVARALGNDGGGATLPLLYARAAHAIDPGHSAAAMYAAELIAESGQYDLAAATFALVPPGDAQYVEAQMGRADALFEVGREAEAITTLRAVADARPELATIHAALGDLLRRAEDCAGAIDAYTDAIDRSEEDQTRFWFVYYTRAICYEQLDNWPPAEADFRKALDLNPDQPNVLNYLGYSLVEQRRNLDEALDMIQRAVTARPDSGYITDSLGWVFYRLGRYDEAVAPMERAVELEPNDPIINDHLGDVYWMVGRYREAEFQWHRALSFDPEPEDAIRIRRKLEVGLDVVLEEEAGSGNTD